MSVDSLAKALRYINRPIFSEGFETAKAYQKQRSYYLNFDLNWLKKTDEQPERVSMRELFEVVGP